MKPAALSLISTLLLAGSSSALAAPPAREGHLREVLYDPQAVIAVPVQRGVVTLIVLDAAEGITEVGTGVGADCTKVDMTWCVAAQPGGHHLFVKPKTGAKGANNVAVVTDKRTYAFRLELVAESDRRSPAYRFVVKQPSAQRPTSALRSVLLPPADLRPAITPQETVRERLEQAPSIRNTSYSIAEGKGSTDIVPTLVFDDGRFTYFRFPNNRVVPTLFEVLPDGSEAIVNARMEEDLLVADRVSRRLVLRSGSAVVGVWNDAFDVDGAPPSDGTTVSGVRRALKPQSAESQSHAGDQR